MQIEQCTQYMVAGLSVMPRPHVELLIVLPEADGYRLCYVSERDVERYADCAVLLRADKLDDELTILGCNVTGRWHEVEGVPWLRGWAARVLAELVNKRAAAWVAERARAWERFLSTTITDGE
jgi:hypothetical protein